MKTEAATTVDAVAQWDTRLQRGKNKAICQYCRDHIKTKNKHISCNNCFYIYHPRCFKKARNFGNYCSNCISIELPYANNDFNSEFLDNALDLNDSLSLFDEEGNQFDIFKNKGLHFIHINARSMFNKFFEIEYIVKKSKAAIVSISETWLDESHTNNSIAIEGYKLVRRDRMAHAGGVCMYINENLNHNNREDLQNILLEDLWVEILLPHTKPLLIGNCYRAPQNSNATTCLESTLNKISLESDVILMGDFNYCLIKNKTNSFTTKLSSNGYSQIIKTPTRVTSTTESLIDHIYTNDINKISQSGVIESGISDHYITFCTRKIFKNPIGKHNKIKIRSMKDYSNDTFSDSLNEKDWSIVTQEKNDVNISLEKFNTMLIDSIDDVAPEKEIRIKGNTEPWIDEEALELIRQRDRALFKSNQNKSNYRLKTKFKELRNKATKVNRKKKAKHFQNKVEENKDNPKKIWDELKTLGYSNKSKEKESIVLEVDNKKIFDNGKVASVINNFYLNVADSLVKKLPSIEKIYDVGSNIFKNYYLSKGVVPSKFKLKCVSETFVLNELKKLNPSKSTGIDGIKSLFLRDGAEIIANAVTHIINLSIKTGIVPDQLKYAKVKPLYKKNSRLDVGNYRPVSILCAISKILERAVHVQLEKYCKDNNLLYEFQSGFRGSYSTDTCLINLSDHIRLLNNQKQLVGMVLIDLQKAFDTVDHDILCKKLEAMGVGSIKWFESYLKGRKQKVVVNESCSEAGIVTCGVPQGSILGPLLFLCYINDMPISVKCKLLLYADDSALIVSGSDQNKIEKELLNELGTCRQ